MQDAVKELGMQILHVGINAKDGDEALGWADEFLQVLGLPVKNGNSSVFSGTMVEIMKGKGRGRIGHIAIGVNDIEKTLEYLAERGVSPLEETRKVVDGKTTFVYLDKEIAGFALHLNLVQ